MTYIVPNYFIEKNDSRIVDLEDIYCINYITKYREDFLSIRNTMHALMIPLIGQKIITTKEEKLDINSSNICFLYQNNYFLSKRVNENLKYKSIVLFFSDKFVLDFIKKYKIKIDKKSEIELFNFDYSKFEELKIAIKSFENYLEKDFSKELLKLKIEELFLLVLQKDEKSLIQFFNKIINTTKDRIKYILESNLDFVNSFEDICFLTRQTPSKIRKYFKDEFNITPKLWINEKRLEKATLLLKTTDETISQIATSCGYSSVSWFILEFKKRYNLTPKDYRYKI
ncbi:helix-turn-helix transcriptional regulator [Aliarcobacter butzleri]|uniref:helix-turn-helix transcriptional regulator n=1 Tax=Aliarcobacter butzleri TaxID=28197 RepID=UPI00215A1771|nr:AraC family transcriptional regulator [Aliarcobacter butzleri]MCR8710105.1 AraC family transcriptional regulator [Aliarcobacter butzleri]